MGIILHILRKDMRRQRWEIALFLAVTAVWAFRTAHPGPMAAYSQFNSYPPILFFALWGFITIRAVQGETLVGDREFWQTRPYRWWQLMAAKAGLLALTLSLPFLLMQTYLITARGIPLAATEVPGLLWMQLFFAATITLPVAALAAITESLVQWVLSVFGLALMALVISWLPWRNLHPTLSASEANATLAGFAICVPLLLMLLFWQYIRRTVWPARGMLLLAALMIPLLFFAAPSERMVAISYPQPAAGVAPPLHLALDTASDGPKWRYGRGDMFRTTKIRVPVIASSIAPDALITMEGTRIWVEDGHGWNWISDWTPTGDVYESGDTRGHLTYSVPTDIADRMVKEHLTAKIEYALKVYRLSSPSRIDTSGESFSVGKFAGCRWPKPFSVRSYYIIGGLQCQAPLDLPDVVVTRVESSDETCAPRENEPALTAGHHAVGYLWKTWTGPADIDPDPIRKFDLSLGAWEPLIPLPRERGEHLQARVCQGTPITVQTGSFVQRIRGIADVGDLGDAIDDPTAGVPEISISQGP
jgi:hypothetical protein